MGNEQSQGQHEGPPEVLEDRDIPSLAKYIKSDKCKNIFVMMGAGVSTSAGIPDFRSPETGLYANLQRLNLPYPEAVFEINFFRENPEPFYTLAKELFPGKFRPTPTHSFVRVLHNRKLLGMCFTQNIDTLERLAGLPEHAVVEAHGSFADQHCIECGARYDALKLRAQILAGEIAYCYECGGLVKPDIVFFGESLPPRFHKTVGLLRSADLLLVIGTSLTVHPFASLTQLVPEGCPRVLVNMTPAGDIGERADDVTLLGRSDEVVRELCAALGDDWVQELDAMWAETAKYAQKDGEDGEAQVETDTKTSTAEERAQEKAVEDEVDKITREIEKSLQIGTVPKDEEPATKTDSEAKSEASAAVVEAPETTSALDENAPAIISTEKVEVVDASVKAEVGEKKKPTEGKL
ncbi:NAD-dependent deacetylase sirtuin-2 [Phanerochaete sordida]|uniref:NAD-dependent protein deacetylase n=1 Tax=Phanerochaete sordida TaxID=48140 RepID=A0A9P3LMC7_9APHY|nr:NAD-dependent deacetylase sirtuin-2 [Phanerochaete sordida]